MVPPCGPARIGTRLSIWASVSLSNIETTVRLLPWFRTGNGLWVDQSAGNPGPEGPALASPGQHGACWPEAEGADASGCGRDASSGAAPHASSSGTPILPLPRVKPSRGPLTSSCDCSAGVCGSVGTGRPRPGSASSCVSSGLSLGLSEPRFSHLRLGKAQRDPPGMKRECCAAVAAVRRG